MRELLDEVQARLAAKMSAPAPAPVINHVVTVTPLSANVYQGSCTCGRHWRTAGKVEVCPNLDWKEYKAQVEAGLREVRKAS